MPETTAEAALSALEARPASSGPVPRYRLSIPGTSAIQLRELEAHARLEGWPVLLTQTRHQGGYCAVFIATDDPQDEVARAINQALPSQRVNVAALAPVDAARLLDQLRALVEGRARFTRGLFVRRDQGPDGR
jgi:hypothetical protein